jgi:hypothetical protein
MTSIQDQKSKVEQEIRKLEDMGGTWTGKARRIRDSAAVRFPIPFVLLTTFGLVATLYGFEKLIDRSTFFANNPVIILGAGLVTLAITGTLFKKLN